ncbi:MAG: hypothetical protein KJ749_02225 [Planctomycetes bacterium]|nr:hypothetical protein [Planctomycetota bacterium]
MPGLKMDEAATVIELPLSARRPVIAAGAELKNTVCVLEGGTATVSPSASSLMDATAYRTFSRQMDAARAHFSGQPYRAAHDLHPASLATQNVLVNDDDRVAVQHHHAHAVSCMAEHGVTDPVIGITCDGTGYGADGAIWGCEILYATTAGFQRWGHLQYLPLPGGDAAARDTWRPALSLVRAAFESRPPDRIHQMFERAGGAQVAAAEAMMRADFNCPRTSSLGRLFDAVAFLAGYGDRNETEGQAAMRMEQAVVHGNVEPYPFTIQEYAGGPTQMVVTEMTTAVCDDILSGKPGELVASRFHETVANMLCEAATRAGNRYKVETVVLSGGCFFNRVLTKRLEDLLSEGGFRQVLKHVRVSPGDAGLSLGQAVVAAAQLEGGR